MKGMRWLALLAAAILSACAQSTPEQQTINDAASALGGRDKIMAVKTLIIEGGGSNGNLGQDVTPEANAQTFTVTDYKRAIDVAAGRARVEQTRTPNFTFFQGQQAQKQVFGIDGDVGYNVAANGTAARRWIRRLSCRIRGPRMVKASSISRRPTGSNSRWQRTVRPSCRRASSR